jgi:hypothetical protein
MVIRHVPFFSETEAGLRDFARLSAFVPPVVACSWCYISRSCGNRSSARLARLRHMRISHSKAIRLEHDVAILQRDVSAGTVAWS